MCFFFGPDSEQKRWDWAEELAQKEKKVYNGLHMSTCLFGFVLEQVARTSLVKLHSFRIIAILICNLI